MGLLKAPPPISPSKWHTLGLPGPMSQRQSLHPRHGCQMEKPSRISGAKDRAGCPSHQESAPLPETTPGHHPGWPQSTSQLGEPGLTPFCSFAMGQGGAEEQGCGWGGLEVTHVCLYMLDTAGVPRDLPTMCQGPLVLLQLLQFGPSSAAPASLRASVPEAAQGGGLKSWAISLLGDPKQATSPL